MSGETLVLTRVFPGVDPQAMYDAWTRPDLVADWYGPEGFTNEIHEMDVRPGGRYHLTMQAPDGSRYPLSGEFRAVEPPHRISFSWKWENQPASVGDGTTLVTVDIRQVGRGTEVTLTHSGFEAAEHRDNHRSGWEPALDKLARTLSGD
ncbi:MAG: SRPBCC domain-containing protein [Rhizobiaceae bacterium]|nr:SRPBCC domain-containing protein [Rhizobiaceae bacterium]